MYLRLIVVIKQKILNYIIIYNIPFSLLTKLRNQNCLVQKSNKFIYPQEIAYLINLTWSLSFHLFGCKLFIFWNFQQIPAFSFCTLAIVKIRI